MLKQTKNLLRIKISHFSQCSQILESTCHEFGDDGNIRESQGAQLEPALPSLPSPGCASHPLAGGEGPKRPQIPLGPPHLLWKGSGGNSQPCWRENPQDQTQRPPK